MKISVIIPSLNPDGKLTEVVEGLVREGFSDIIVVNDGSDENHMEPFNKVAEYPQVTVLKHDHNCGKGRALKTAYEFCIANRPEIDGVVTVDGDNQHLSKDIKACCEALLKHGDKVILGCRNFTKDNIPPKSRIGNNITRFVFRFMCRIKISDTQTGLRAIPASYLPMMVQIKGERFEYETRVLLECRRHNIEFEEVEIDTVYIEENASTHFHPFRDSFKIYMVIIRYLLGNLWSFIKYVISSLLSFLIDNGLFRLIEFIIGSSTDRGMKIFLATAIARIVSSVFNFFVNRKAVFKSDAGIGITMLKYYALCICQMGASYGLVLLFSNLFNANDWFTSLIKIVVDLMLFILSYQIQRRWVFADSSKKEEE
ncbi:MAG: glycosyltransferase [Butyrivibrio sp.]